MSTTNPNLPDRIAGMFPGWFTQSNSAHGVVLGLGAFGHDGGAVIVDDRDGRVLFALAEERLTNRKHDWHFPIGSVVECCREAIRLGLPLRAVAVNFRRDEFVSRTLFQEIDRIGGDAEGIDALKSGLLERISFAQYFDVHNINQVNETTEGIADLIANCDVEDSKKERLALRASWYFNWSVKYQRISEQIDRLFQGIPIHYVNHHLAHAASAFYNSGFSEATVLTIDGSGEAESATIYRGDELGLHLVSRTCWPNSLGIFYLMATQHLGFGLGDEYKVMGMSAYGEPKYADIIRNMFRVSDDGRIFQEETEYQHLVNLLPTGHIVYQFTEQLAGLVPQRTKQEPILQSHFDFAASIQRVTEEVGVELTKKAIGLARSKNVAIAGGVGLNGLMNEAIRTKSGCNDLFIYPAAGDDGTAVGAAQMIVANDAIKSGHPMHRQRLTACYLGHDVTTDEIASALDQLDIKYSRPESIYATMANSLADGNIIARCQGRAEFGPRALGNRSILAHPGLATMKETLNTRVKHREEFRPFAPACLREKVSEYFEIDCDAPFMLLITRARELARQRVPAVVHADGTARVQSVSPIDHPDFYRVISEFESITGIPMLLNTSFNVNGETIVDNAIDAIESFGFMDIDFLALGPFWISKVENQAKFPPIEHDDYLKKRQVRFAQRNLGPLTQLDISKFDDAFLNVEQAVKEFVQAKCIAHRVG